MESGRLDPQPNDDSPALHQENEAEHAGPEDPAPSVTEHGESQIPQEPGPGEHLPAQEPNTDQPVPGTAIAANSSPLAVTMSPPAFPALSQKRHFWSTYDDWWLWELLGMGLSVGCLAAIIVILGIQEGKPLSSWHFPISINALISTFSTVLKASLMLSVASCLGQLKWLHIKNDSHSLADLETYDRASRGPWGSVFLIYLGTQKLVSHPSPISGLALLGAACTILTLASDPFTQQILSFPDRQTLIEPDQSGAFPLGISAQIPTARSYDPRSDIWGYYYEDTEDVGVYMQGAVMNGLYGLNSPASFDCSTTNCTWPKFYTLGICSSCSNITTVLNTTCELVPGGSRCTYTTPRGLALNSRISAGSGGSTWTRLNCTARPPEVYDLNNTDHRTLLEMAAVKIHSIGSGPGSEEQPEAIECILRWCVRSYDSVQVVNGRLNVPVVTEYTFASFNTTHWQGTYSLNVLTLSSSSEAAGNRTFLVNSFVTPLFLDAASRTSEGATARMLWATPNMTLLMYNIADSMTNHIRQGPNSTGVVGVAQLTETYIRVSWAWIALPAVVVVMGAVLLVASILMTSYHQSFIWKTSILPTIYAQLEGWDDDHGLLGTKKLSQLSGAAKEMNASLRTDDSIWLSKS